MRTIREQGSAAVFLLLSVSGAMRAESAAPLADPVTQAQRQITAYLAQLADLHCTETVTQEKLGGNGHVLASQRAQYDYLIMINGGGEDFQLNESRIESSEGKQPSLPMLVTNGISTILLVFHPYYRDGFQFEVGNEEHVNGQSLVPVHFAHYPGRRTPAALALRGREYPLDLEGTAWLEKQSGNVVMVNASLLRDMSDVGMRALDIHVEYKPTSVDGRTASLALPSLAVVEVTTARQRWRNRHEFTAYKSFSANAQQDPNVRLHDDAIQSTNPAAEEKKEKQ